MKPRNVWSITLLEIAVCSSSVFAQITQTKLLPSDGEDGEFFGHTVSISGDRAVVGAHRDDDNGAESGSAYIFHFDGANWVQEAKLLASDGDANDHFGFSVSISGDYALVGTPNDKDNRPDAGSAYIFHFDGVNWVEQVKLLASDGKGDDQFGYSVSISDDHAIIGTYVPQNGINEGFVYIFHFDGSNWVEEAKLFAPDGVSGDYFGNTVSISGDIVVVGAWGVGGGDPGAAYLFSFDGSSWVFEDKLIAGDPKESDSFGWSVGVAGDYVIIGATGDDDNGSSSGSAYIFHFDGSAWVQQSKLLASDGKQWDEFGQSVSIAGDFALVGATGVVHFDGSTRSPQSVDGKERDAFEHPIAIARDYSPGEHDVLSGGKSAYLFQFDGTDWLQSAKLVGSGAIEGFGHSVALHGDHAMVGAYGDSGKGNLTGSAYIYSNLSHTVIEIPCDSIDDFQARCGQGGILQARILLNSTRYANQNVFMKVDGVEYTTTVVTNGVNSIATLQLEDQVLGEHLVELTKPAGCFDPLNVICPRPAPPHIQESKLLASNGESDDRFGWSVSISGDYAVVGMLNLGQDSDFVYIFRRDQAIWTEATILSASDGVPGDWFGSAVSIFEDRIVVGAFNGGYAYVFRREGEEWIEEAKLRGNGGEFGDAAEISADHIIVGAPQDENNGTNTGAAYIFSRVDTTWTLESVLTPDDGSAFDAFGYSVALSGIYAVVGALGDDDYGYSSGSAYVFVNEGTSWSQVAKILPDGGGSTYDFFGGSVSISGDYIAVGDPGEDNTSPSSEGSCYIFKHIGNSWTQEAKVTVGQSVSFGQSVSIAGDSLAVGSPGNNNSQGSAYLFRREGTNWIEEEEFIASDGSAGDDFGYSISLSDDDVVVGATYDDDLGNASGSAYVFSGLLAARGSLTKLNQPNEGKETSRIPATTLLEQNFPDPFNPSTTIRYALSQDAHVTLRVYNMLGQLVATLVDEPETAGYRSVVWNGRNHSGASVASGIYIYRITAGTFVQTKRMLLLK